jgi:hypothetical protein
MPESEKRTNSEKAWEMYLEVGNGERHFNQLEHQYRLLASTWPARPGRRAERPCIV